MVKNFLLLPFLLGIFITRAECYYADYELTLEVTTGGNKLVCYQSISTCYFDLDSINDSEYLLRALSTSKTPDSIKVYKYKFHYAYCLEEHIHCPESEKNNVSAFFEEIVIAKKEVQHIKVTEHFNVSSLEYISTELKLSDTLWFTQHPVDVISCDSYLCAHTISVYQKSPELTKVLSDIKSLKSEMVELETTIDHTNGDLYDEKLWLLIDELNTLHGAITVSGCTD